MNKKLNTTLFIIGATLANIVVMLLLFLLSLFLIAKFVDPESSLMPLWIGLMFLFSIGGSFFIYTVAMKKITVKFDLENRLDPIFHKRRPGGPRKEG